ncbi:MAG: efflux RND transporter periplasmic adaptor subunit [Rhodocyclaceae bacterium]
MNKTTLCTAVAVALVVGAGAGWMLNARLANSHASHADAAAAASSRAVLYWYDPMKPDQHFDKPGKSPFMDMDLVPRYADETAETAAVRIDPTLAQNTGVKFATVTRGQLTSALDVTGTVVFNDRDVAIAQARAGGIVERVYARAAGDVIAAGAPIADIRVPEWLAAQREYLAVRNDAELAAASRSRLLQLGMTASQVVALERTNTPQAVLTVSAPRGGMLAEWSVREGMIVTAGQTLARINGLSSVWVEADVPEAQSSALKPGTPVRVRIAASPDDAIAARIETVVPELNATTRTVRVRTQIPNRNGALRPGMYARIELTGSASQAALLVPSDAVIATGTRHVVIVAEDAGKFAPAEVRVGRERDGQSEILAGLAEGQRVVVSGQFMIDSEASLRGVLARMASASAPAATAQVATARGVVRAVDGHSITLEHEPVPSLQWPAMTMPFELADPTLAARAKPGDTVRFTFRNDENGAVVTDITQDGGTR